MCRLGRKGDLGQGGATPHQALAYPFISLAGVSEHAHVASLVEVASRRELVEDDPAMKSRHWTAHSE